MNCVVLKTQQLLSKKWTILILQEIFYSSELSFNEITRKLHSATNKVVSRRLHELEKEGIVHKIILPMQRRSTRYMLTPQGKDLLHAFDILKRWGMQLQDTPSCLNTNCNQCSLKK